MATERDDWGELGDEGDDEGEAVPDIERMWLDNAGRYPLLSQAGEQAAGRGERICTCCRDGREALINHNLRLIALVAKRKQLAGTVLAVEDLWQEGVKGLITAASRYDPARGNKFATMALWWIRQAINAHVRDKGRAIREPAYVAQFRSKLVALREAHPDWGEAELRATLSTYIARLVGRHGEVQKLTDETWYTLVKGSPIVVSLDKPVTHKGTANEQTLGDFVIDPHTATPEDVAVKQDTRERVRAALAKLPERWQLILVARHVERKTLLEVGELLGVTRERVRQLQVLADTAMRDALAGSYDSGLPAAHLMVHSFSQPALPLADAPPKVKQRPAPLSLPIPPQSGQPREPQPSVTNRQPTAARRRASLSQSSADGQPATVPVALFSDGQAASNGTPTAVTSKTNRNRVRLSSAEQGATRATSAKRQRVRRASA